MIVLHVSCDVKPELEIIYSCGRGIAMLGARIAALRRSRGMSQQQLAAQLDVSASAVGMYEQGRREPASDRIVAIARICDVSTDYLLTGEPVTPGDRAAVGQLFVSLQEKSEQEIVVRRRDGTTTRLSRQELAMACAALLG